ncbi:MAG: hypothetical protein FJ272_05345 [Planctomycetes bacterium]|nr:hypothetical protein [Planctomycetota bacterium]
MYKFHPSVVYVTDRALSSPLTVKRLDRMLAAVECKDVRRVTDAELNDAVKERGWFPGGRTGEARRPDDPDLVLNGFVWRTPQEEAELRKKHPALAPHMLLGNGCWGFRDGPSYRSSHGGVCQAAWEIHAAFGCLHACQYCHVGNVLNVMLNLEEYVQRLDEFAKTIPWQKLYKYDNQTDTICLEPEYGASEVMVSYFATQRDKWLMLYTKSDNVDHLLGLKHNGHTIINWTLSCDTTCREIEKKAPSLAARVRAMKLCQDAGYTVRARFSPIVPVRGWREENRRMVELLFSLVKPDLVSMDVLAWMDAAKMRGAMDVSLFDDDYLRYVEEMDAAGAAKRAKPFWPEGKQFFSHELRARIYRFMLDEIRRVSPSTRVAICMETPEMWADFGPELGMKPEDYACCCGPTSVPGHPMLLNGQ